MGISRLCGSCKAIVSRGPCLHCQAKRERIRDQSRDRRAYDSREWRDHVRPAKLWRDPICEFRTHCNGDPATEVDHRDGNPHNNAPDNLRSGCKPCHSARTATEQSFGRSVGGLDLSIPEGLLPSRIPLTLVYGPPGSGKTTYVQERALPTDLVVDMDAIKAELSGLPWYMAGDTWVAPALKRRNELLASLAAGPSFTAAWFIVTAGWASHRRKWQSMLKPAATVMLNVPAEVCIARIRNDARRANRVAEHCAEVSTWWQRFSADSRSSRSPRTGPWVFA